MAHQCLSVDGESIKETTIGNNVDHKTLDQLVLAGTLRMIPS
jgi:hypothetical protein